MDGTTVLVSLIIIRHWMRAACEVLACYPNGCAVETKIKEELGLQTGKAAHRIWRSIKVPLPPLPHPPSLPTTIARPHGPYIEPVTSLNPNPHLPPSRHYAQKCC